MLTGQFDRKNYNIKSTMAWDLCMQFGHQTQAFRVIEFFGDPLLRQRLFPGTHFAAAARELGPRTENAGPGLALFTGLELTPEEVLRWFTATGCLLRRHCTRLYWLPRQDVLNVLNPGRQQGTEPSLPLEPLTVESDTSLQQPAACTVSTSGQATSSREALLSDISNSALPPGAVLRLQCRPKALETFLEVGHTWGPEWASCPFDLLLCCIQQKHLPDSFQLHPSTFTHVLQAVEADGWTRWSLVPAAWLYRQSKDEEKVLPDSVAHAVNKLDEALLVSGLRISGRMRAAIDVGAAPGAWSMYLAGVSDLVLAVDPAQLHQDAARVNIVHICKKAEDAVQDIEQLLCGAQADILTCDMNIHPTRSSQVIQSLLHFLKPGGVVILTLKFMGTGRDRGKTERYLRDLYAGVLEDGRMTWLLANTVFEQTWIALKGGRTAV